jgi:hypothetical protein
VAAAAARLIVAAQALTASATTHRFPDRSRSPATAAALRRDLHRVAVHRVRRQIRVPLAY